MTGSSPTQQNAPMSSSSPVAAFFDVDNTLIPGSAIELRFFRYLWTQGVVGWREASSSLAYLLRHGGLFSWQALRAQKPYLGGKQATDIQALGHAFVSEVILSSLSREGMARIAHHQAQRHQVVLVTGCLDLLIAPLAMHLGITSALTARPEHRDGVFTGRLHLPVPYGPGKRELIDAFARANDINLQQSYAYGDSPGDVELLQAVKHPLVVNPIRGMDAIARRHGWPMTEWR